jgi:hypothetical protein
MNKYRLFTTSSPDKVLLGDKKTYDLPFDEALEVMNYMRHKLRDKSIGVIIEVPKNIRIKE